MLVQGLHPVAPGGRPVFDLPYVPIAAALITGLATWIAARGVARSNEKIAQSKRSDETLALAATLKATDAEDLTHRLRLLMDGYERRINGLTAEVAGLREEIGHLSDQLKKCSSCPYFRGHDGTD
jgi:hypothetical protein